MAGQGTPPAYIWDPVDLDWSEAEFITLRLSVPTAAVPSALVTNWEQFDGLQTSSGTSRVQRFTTGSNTGGYTLSSIGMISGDAEGDSFSATVCPVNAQGYPPSPPGTVASDSTCWALTPPGDFSPGLLTFTAPASTVLAKDTTYTVVFVPTSSTVHFRGTNSDAEDSGGSAGWSINNAYDFYSTSGAAYRTDSRSRAVRIAVRGSDGHDPHRPRRADELHGDGGRRGSDAVVGGARERRRRGDHGIRIPLFDGRHGGRERDLDRRGGRHRRRQTARPTRPA